jgi:pyrroline-5-carboxylate reductase
MREALAGVAPEDSATVISIAAGLRLDTLRRWLEGSPAAIVRAMPNTPALLRAGVTGLFAPAGTPQHSRDLAARILGSVGAVCWLEEERQLDAVTALSGSGPAYFFLVAEALREAGAALGLDAPTAALLAQKTLAGAGRMAESGADVAVLRASVTSKGGTTEAALARLERGGLRGLFADALRAAAERGRELGEALAK